MIKFLEKILFFLFKHIFINANVNGALNILLKVIGNYSYNPIKVCSTPLALEPRN